LSAAKTQLDIRYHRIAVSVNQIN